jgi:SAM-dependent methyltransferase
MNLFEHFHDRYMRIRRMRILSEHLAALIPKDALVLDVGCGDGQLSFLISQKRPDLQFKGVDVLVRDRTYIPVDEFAGQVIPYDNGSLDVVMFADVLHHTEDPMILLGEAVRVVRSTILVKDHICNGMFPETRLRFMDWVGNARFGVALPYNYWSKQNWLDAFLRLNLTIEVWRKDLGLYPRPASWIFGRSLHFIAKLSVS